MTTTHENPDSLAVLRLIAEHTKLFKFPNLSRPPVPLDEAATRELVDWGGQIYCFSWLRHVGTLVSGIVTLSESANTPSAYVVARSVFELGAHAYYVKKHLKQHLDSNNLDEAWNFLTPVTTGSRYINQRHPEIDELVSEPPHIAKAIACFGEVLADAKEAYSFMSEFSHPNAIALSQYYQWPNPYEVRFVDNQSLGIFEPTEAACLADLLAISEMLRLANEKAVVAFLNKLLGTIAA